MRKGLFICLIVFSGMAFSDMSQIPVDEVTAPKIKKLDNRYPLSEGLTGDILEIQRLTPYESISVIQRRYMPKTFRGELNVSMAAIVNHHFFYLFGLTSRLGMFLREDHGFGVDVFAFLPAFGKQVTRDLINNKIIPLQKNFNQFYAGGYYKWSPIFGKFSVLNEKIIYFDMYLVLGAGVSRFASGLSQELKEAHKIENDLAKDFFPSFSGSLGQLFSYSQSIAWNWELKLLYTPLEYQGVGISHRWDLSFAFGVNYYFPDVGYR